jgi:predicted MFS family arabinose efflux permease
MGFGLKLSGVNPRIGERMRSAQEGVASIINGKLNFIGSAWVAPSWWTVKTKLILSAGLLVVFAMQFNSLFNRTSLDKLYLDAAITDLSIQGREILSGYSELGSQNQNYTSALIEAALTAVRDGILTEMGMMEAIVGKKHHVYLKIAIVSPEGRISNSTEKEESGRTLPLPLLNHFKDLLKASIAPVAGQYLVDGEDVYIGYPNGTNDSKPGGMVLLTVGKAVLIEKMGKGIYYPNDIMWAVTLTLIATLTMTLCRTMPDEGFSRHLIGAKYNTIIIVLCFLSQAMGSIIFTLTYERQLVDLQKEKLLQAQVRMAKEIREISELDRGEMEYAMKIKSHRTMELYKVVEGIGFQVNNGIDTLFSRSSKTLEPPWHSRLLQALFQIKPIENISTFNSLGYFKGKLKIYLSQEYLLSRLREILLDAVTVLVISVLVFIEMLLFIGNVFQPKEIENEKSRKDTAWDPEDHRNGNLNSRMNYRWMRLAAFLLLFAIDLSMSFIPLHLAKLYQPVMGLSKDLIMGLPITVEFTFVGISIFLSGFWVDRRGWHEPFIIGLALTANGIIYSWLATNAIHFIISRAFVGIGYGLALMASQGFVIRFSDWKSKASGLADLFAGIYAGSICGGATGAMLADRYGYNYVFLIGAVIIYGIMAYCFIFMRPAMITAKTGELKDRNIAKGKSAGFWGFLSNRIVISLIFLSSMPASIAVVGFLNYFCPIYLNGLNISQSAIGRILMLYGICLVYIGPIIGRYVDLSMHKKNYVFIGCLLGSFPFLMFSFANGVLAATIAVFILSMSSSFVLSSQSAYILNLKVTKAYGEGKAIGIFRSSSRIGQALGPIVFSNLMLMGSLEKGIRIFGVIYLVTAVMFILLTRKDRSHTLQEA